MNFKWPYWANVKINKSEFGERVVYVSQRYAEFVINKVYARGIVVYMFSSEEYPLFFDNTFFHYGTIPAYRLIFICKKLSLARLWSEFSKNNK